VASAVVAAPGWALWTVQGQRTGALVAPLATTLILAANAGLTWAAPSLKVRLVRALQRVVINPTVRLLLAVEVLPLGYALIETTGRRSGHPRRTPVGNGLVGDTFWIVAEHGSQANYVRNLTADPHVRVKLRHGVRLVWREGVAHVLEDDDPYQRQRTVCRWHPLRAFNAAVVRVMGADLVTIRVDLDAADQQS
jgi:deazaflavin-dependent oxidoreductase (nitroreductase family)